MSRAYFGSSVGGMAAAAAAAVTLPAFGNSGGGGGIALPGMQLLHNEGYQNHPLALLRAASDGRLGRACACFMALVQPPCMLPCFAGALVGARHGSSWLPEQWLSQLETDAAGVVFFNTPPVEAVLSAQHPAGPGVEGGCAQQHLQEPQLLQRTGEAAASEQQLVLTTKNMGREGAVVLARLLAQIDYRGA